MSNVALDQLVAVIAEFKREDPMAPVTVLVPSNVSGRAVGWRLAQGLGNGRTAVAGLRITTLARMAESVAAVTLQPRRPLLPSILAAAWRSELEAASSLDGWVFADVWEHPSTVAALVNAYRDLREVPERLDFGHEAGTVPQETIRLARGVRSRLRVDWYDQQDLFLAASRLADDDPAAFREFGSIVHYLPGDESLTALTFLESLNRAIGVRTVDDPQPHHADRILHASDSDDEVRAVLREVMAELGKGAKAHRLAIVYTRPDPYVRVIHGLLRGAGIAFNGRGGIPVSEISCARAFLTILELRARKYPRAQLFEALASWPMRQLGSGERTPLVSWERISREANVAGGEELDVGWSRRLATFAGHERNALRRDHIDSLAAFVTALDERLRAIDGATSWQQVSTLASSLLTDLLGELDDIRSWQQDEKRAFVTLFQTLGDLRALDEYGPPGGLDALVDILTTELESAVPREGKFGHGVFVGPVSQARGLDLDRIWVVGLAEDMYPGRQQEGALLPEPLRATTPGLLTARDRVGRLERDLTRAFAAAAQVTATFPRGDLRASTEKLPSRLLLPSLRLLVGRPHLAATTWQSAPSVPTVIECASHAAGVRNTPSPATEQEWAMRSALAAHDSLDDPVYLAARHLLGQRWGPDFTRFDGNLNHVEGLPDLARGERFISPTALESYARCPYAYFIRRLLRVEPVEEPTVNSAIAPIALGNIFHHAFDRFFTAEQQAGSLPEAGQPWTPTQHARLKEVVDRVISEFEERGELGHPTLWSFIEPKVRADLDAMLSADSTWRAGVGAAPVAAELRFGGDDPDRPAAVVPVPGGEVRFVGSADKVDVAGDTVFITDIKTGKADGFRKIDPNRGEPNWTMDGTKLQLPVYAKAALAAIPDATMAQAQYWFVHGRSAGERVKLPLHDEVAAHFSSVVGTLVGGIARGHFFKKPSKEPGFLWVDCEFCTPGRAGHEATRRSYVAKRRHPDLIDILEVIDPEGAEEVRRAAWAGDEHDDH